MPIESISVAGYRSVRNLRLDLGAVNVLTGPNGCGKSNLYQSMYLLSAAANGELARTLAEEGGLPSALWAGPLRKQEPHRVSLGVDFDGFRYECSCGMPIPLPGSVFNQDPEVKEERLSLLGRRRVVMMERSAGSTHVRNAEGERVTFPFDLSTSESVLAQVKEPHRFPHLSRALQEFRGWRFYHYFPTDPTAPQRHPQIGVRTPVLDKSGHHLAAALQTIREIGDRAALNAAIDDAFPGARLEVEVDAYTRFSVALQMPGIPRSFEARELSDGTLRYLCLLAALLSPRPPSLLALNEPETSLHPDLLVPLARLINQASRYSQIWITTHSSALAEAIEDFSGQRRIRLEKVDGETHIIGQNALGIIVDD